MRQRPSRWWILLTLAVAASTACAFDASNLGECRSDGECSTGRCVDRVCVPALPDAGGDTELDGLPDVVPDAPADGGEDLDAEDLRVDPTPDAEDAGEDGVADAADVEDGGEDGALDVADIGEETGDTGGDTDADVAADADADADAVADADADAETCPETPFCEDTVAVFCNESDAVERLDCALPETCPDTDAGCYCDAGECVARVCAPDLMDCVDDQVVLCDADGADYSVLETCDVTEICVGGACETNTCTPETTFCMGEVLVSCSTEGVIEIVEDCRIADGYCDGDTLDCLPTTCTPGERQCAVDPESGADIVEECDTRGIGFELLTECAETQTCSDGECQGAVCEANSSTSCASLFARSVCRSDGSGYDVVPCDPNQYCDDSGGTATCEDGVCAPGSSHCLPGTEAFETCNDAGSGYDPSVSCQSDEYCDGGECLDQVCVPGATSCDDDFTLRYCDDRGSVETVEGCGEGRYCEGSTEPATCEVQVCTPDALFCNSDGDVEQCDSRGASSSFSEGCDYTCFDGECLPPFCGDGLVTASEGEECDDRNDDQCDGCDDCQEVFALGLAAAGSDTTTRAQWLPGTSVVTLEAWVLTTASGTLIGVGQGSNNYVWLQVDGTGHPVFSFNLGGSQTTTVTGPDSIMDGAWHHVAGMRTNSSDGALYVDGAEVATTDESHGNSSIDDGDIFIGADEQLDSAGGQIDEVRISNVVRYTADFTPARRFEADGDTIALYHLDEGTGTAVGDSSGNDRNLVMSGVTWVPDDCYDGVFAP